MARPPISPIELSDYLSATTNRHSPPFPFSGPNTIHLLWRLCDSCIRNRLLLPLFHWPNMRTFAYHVALTAPNLSYYWLYTISTIDFSCSISKFHFPVPVLGTSTPFPPFFLCANHGSPVIIPSPVPLRRAITPFFPDIGFYTFLFLQELSRHVSTARHRRVVRRDPLPILLY